MAMMNQTGLRRILPDQLSGSGHTFGTPRHPSIKDPILSKRVCFYKSGDPQFNGLRMVINNRTFKTFDALLDSLSKKVPLPFGVRNITTPRGVHAIYTLDELEDGKSYICSDRRKVKPINLALARKKPPPWYHARPVSSLRRTVQQARNFPGRTIHRQEPVIVRTPKRLLVFRNGDPTLNHTVVLHKRTTATFESILEYISDLMQFHVVKLHTPDGRRVDGLPGLILCSGTVVAAGREPFKSVNYTAQKSPAQTHLTTNRMGLRRLKSLNRKNKSLSYSSKSRNFSLSSERYIVNQIHDSIAKSSCDRHLPSNPTNSVELGRMLESIAGSEGDTCLGDGAEGQGCLLPSEDDIEKSFRVNQDGSMTVEMKVRLTLKEEETIHWTTTLTRSSVGNELDASCLPDPDKEQEICSSKPDSLDLQSSASTTDTINKDKTKDNNDEDPPCPRNGLFSESRDEEDNIKVQTNLVSPRRTPTPGYKQIRKKYASVESIKSLTAEGMQEGVVGSYSYQEQTEIGDMTEQYCVVKQSTSRPVPKPRILGSVHSNNIQSSNISTLKSAGMTEILQIESSGEEVTETVLQMYEQQTCQDNFLANICAQDISASGISLRRPATSETGQFSSKGEFQPAHLVPDPWRPSTAESIGIWRTENMSATSDLTFPSLKTDAIQATNRQQQLSAKGKDKTRQREVSKGKRISSKPKVINKRVRRLLTPGKRKKDNSAEETKIRTKVKTFSNAGFIKKIYGNKSKSAKSTMKLEKRPTQKGDGGFTTKSSQPSHDTNTETTLNESSSETISLETSRLNVSWNEVSQPRGKLTRKTSMHQGKKNENKFCDINKSKVLPACISPSSVTNEYVQNWLEKVPLNPTSCPDEEASILVQTENGMCGQSEYNHGLIAVVEGGKFPEDESVIQLCQILKSDPLPESSLGTSVKLRIQGFEYKSSSPSVEKTTLTQGEGIAPSHTTITNTANCTNIVQNNTEEVKPLFNGVCHQINPGTTLENISGPSNTISMEFLPPPPSPPPAEMTELSNNEYCMMNVSSVASSPLYRLSSVSSQMSDNHPLSISPTSDKAISPTDRAMETTTSLQLDIPAVLREAQLPRTPSIKRTPLVSNISLERKMSLRKASLHKYTLFSDVTASSTPIMTAGEDDNVLTNSFCSTGTHLPTINTQISNIISDLKSSQPCCTSASPTSVTSGDRISSASISSSETPTPSDIQKTQFLTKKEESSPKPLMKKGNIISNPSQKRIPPTKNMPPKLSSLYYYHSDKTMSPIIVVQEHKTPTPGPSTERRKMLNKDKVQKRPSPYSQSLDMVSPPARNKSNRKMLSRNLSSDNATEPENETKRKTSSQRKHHQKPQSIKSTAEQNKTLICDTLMQEASQIEKNKAKKIEYLTNADQEKSVTQTQLMPQPINIANQSNMKPVLDQICYSIKSIRQITQNKHPSCLEKSNSLPDFSSHVASTFGSSSKALLAFLSVMTLKEGKTNFNKDEIIANNFSCAEALKIIDSLREIASIEDSHKLKAMLTNLQCSTSKQLLQSWRSFQELIDKCNSRSSTSNYPQQELITNASPENDCGIEENVIDQIIDNLDIPEKLKEELGSLSVEVKTESDDKENIPTRFIDKVELSQKDNRVSTVSHCSTEDVVNVRFLSQDKANIDVRSIIKKFSNIKQSKQSDMHTVPLITETVKHKPTYQALKSMDSQYEQSGVAKSPPAESNDIQIPEVKLLSVEEEIRALNSCKEENLRERKQHQGHIKDKSKQETTNMNGVISSKNNLENKNSEIRKLQMQSEGSTSIPENEISTGDESGAVEEGQNIPSAPKDVEQIQSCKQSISSSEEEQAEYEKIKQDRCEQFEEEEDKQPRSNYYVELNVNRKQSISSPDSQNQSLTEEEQPEEPDIQKSCKELNVSVDENTGTSDVDEPTSSKEGQSKVEHKELKVRTEESLPGTEEEKGSINEKEHLHDLPDPKEAMELCQKLKALIEETEEDKVSSEDEDLHTHKQISDTENLDTVHRDLSYMIEKQDSYTKKDNSSWLKSNSIAKCYRFQADEDSGNDHCSCEEQPEMEQPNIAEIGISIKEEFSYYEKESTSEKEEEYREGPASTTKFGDTKSEKVVEIVTHQSEEIISQSVPERVNLLEQQVADAQRRKHVIESHIRKVSQKNGHMETDVEESPSECSRSAPQSSLSFSYDSSGMITTEPEGNRVRSIREMFLAKSATDIKQGHRRFPSPSASELSELRADTSASGGYQSQTSIELSSVEDDSARKSITKGFVRRTIERLYGKKDVNPDEKGGERPPSAPKQKKKEHSGMFSPFHTAKSKAMTELSYFNSTDALDTLGEATRCIAFNAQVGPGDIVPIDNGRWLLRQNTLIRKSVSDPVGINKALTNTNTPLGEGTCEDMDQNDPCSLFRTTSELEDKTNSLSRKCTYFSLPHASDSDVCQDDDSITKEKDNSEETKAWTERNGKLPAVGVTDFKMMDNKVHPLIEVPSDGEVVVVQPGRGQGVMNRRLQEPDMLDLLYNFCGSHCPIL
ncbi:hypothetical protein F2P81_021825 [Scophthalmus maximus]|uniref:Doublecortin domain-containing protein n=1 Tax=Scophthalmus maximus TaxID=52904 RepID=A0A6A4S328_SCOMX|nr:hypothetical protein F2P81_021825 [Scophthalmus maximus]